MKTEIVEEIKKAVQEAVKESYPSEWMSPERVCSEFEIGATTLWKLVKDKADPMPFSTLGTKKKLFKRQDIYNRLESRKRNG